MNYNTTLLFSFRIPVTSQAKVQDEEVWGNPLHRSKRLQGFRPICCEWTANSFYESQQLPGMLGVVLRFCTIEPISHWSLEGNVAARSTG